MNLVSVQFVGFLKTTLVLLKVQSTMKTKISLAHLGIDIYLGARTFTMRHGVWTLGGPILKECFQNFPPDPYITLCICKTENPGV